MNTAFYLTGSATISRHLRTIALCLAAFMFTSCSLSQRVKLNEADRQTAQAARRITLIHYYPPSPLITTPADALVASGKYRWSENAPPGYSAGRAVWKARNARGEFPNVMPIMKTRFVKGLKREARLTNLHVLRDPIAHITDANGYKPPDQQLFNEFRKRYGNGLVMEFQTPQWQMHYKASNWKVYNMMLLGSVRLIDLKGPRVLWQGICGVNGASDKALQFRLGDMNAQEAAKMTNGIIKAATQCGDDLVHQYMAREG